MSERSKKPRFVIEAVESETMRGRYHFRVLNKPDFLNASATGSNSEEPSQ